MTRPLALTVNGLTWNTAATATESLLTVLRDRLGLTGAKQGCDDSECGACIVLVDGRPVNSCSYLALQVQGRAVTTVEGLRAPGHDLHPLQRAFIEEGAVQCGFCTPGMLMSAEALLTTNATPTADEVRRALAGNLCRCTGYTTVVRAVLRAAEEQSANGT